MVDVNWQTIRPWNGSQSGGFEELCTQLARAESPTGTKFHRKGSPDAGVDTPIVYALVGWIRARPSYAIDANTGELVP